MRDLAKSVVPRYNYRMKRVYVELEGGFGNQLFQMAAGIQYRLNTGSRIFFLFVDSGRFDDFAIMCREAYEVISQKMQLVHPSSFVLWNMTKRRDRFKWKLMRLFNSIGLAQTLKQAGSFDDFFAESSNFIKVSRKPTFVKGFFQSGAHIREGVEFVIKSLCSYFPPIEDRDFRCIHIRRGDFASKGFMENFGLLNDNYFGPILARDWKGKTVAITQNMEDVINLYQKNKTAIWRFANEMDWQQSFRVLCSSRQLYISNSTFSLWAGLVVTKRGGEVLYPDPWSKGGNSLSSLLPGGKAVPSLFN